MIGYLIPIIGQAKIFSVSIANSLLSLLNLLKWNNRDPRETSLYCVYSDIQFNKTKIPTSFTAENVLKVSWDRLQISILILNEFQRVNYFLFLLKSSEKFCDYFKGNRS